MPAFVDRFDAIAQPIGEGAAGADADIVAVVVKSRRNRRRAVDHVSRGELIVVVIALDQAISVNPMRAGAERAEGAVKPAFCAAVETRAGAVEVDRVERRHAGDQFQTCSVVTQVDHRAIHVGAEGQAIAPENQVTPDLH